MKNVFVQGLMMAMASVLTFGCSSMKNATDKAMTTPSSETQTAARAAGAAQVIEVNFDRGSAVLTEGAREALRDMVSKVKSEGQIDEMNVLAWADRDYPADSKTKASKADRDLADRRASAINNFLKSELAINDVDTYNMSERPNAAERLFNTSDAKMKQAFEDAGVTGNGGKSLTGKASRAVVTATLEK